MLDRGLREAGHAVDGDVDVVGDRRRADRVEHVLDGDIDASAAVVVDAGVEDYAQERVRGAGRQGRDPGSTFVGGRTGQPAVGGGGRGKGGGVDPPADRKGHGRRGQRGRKAAAGPGGRGDREGSRAVRL